MKEPPEDIQDEQVCCSRCGTDVCGLSVIPQIAGECSTMEGIQNESSLELGQEVVGTKRIDVESDLLEPNSGEPD